MLQPNDTREIGGFQFKITASVSTRNTRSECLESLNVFTAPRSIPALVWALQSASELSNASAGGSGWNQNSAEVQRCSLRSPLGNPSEKDTGLKPYSILLIEDNNADVGLVREALGEHNVE